MDVGVMPFMSVVAWKGEGQQIAVGVVIGVGAEVA